MLRPLDEDADYQFMALVIDEARRSRLKFPPPPHTPLAGITMQAAASVIEALVDLQAGRISREDYVAECVQLAAMALRLACEGDPGLPASQVLPSIEQMQVQFTRECAGQAARP